MINHEETKPMAQNPAKKNPIFPPRLASSLLKRYGVITVKIRPARAFVRNPIAEDFPLSRSEEVSATTTGHTLPTPRADKVPTRRIAAPIKLRVKLVS